MSLVGVNLWWADWLTTSISLTGGLGLASSLVVAEVLTGLAWLAVTLLIGVNDCLADRLIASGS